MIQIMKKCHRYLYLGVVILLFILLFPLLYFFSRKISRFKTLNHIRRFYALISSFFVGFIYRYKVETPIDWSKSYIICANHTSNLDISVVTCAVKANFAFIGKDELLDNPLLSLFFKTIDIPLNRESKISAFKAFKRGEEYLKRGMSLVIFPEGKIGDEYPPVLHEFKNGPFRLAIEQQVAIIPISINGVWKKMWDDGTKYGSAPGISHICIHQPVETKGMTLDDAEALKEKIFTIIHSELQNEY
ncbi:MAG: 1-acyl-sn-glycerol-3-phosphate acyltransferase [Pyrinomonadaceae bacterium]|nr:1-acyl-sn-glycerol-3-phosphate acyltransferase [Sphingobacteriaceae bacterium]